MVYKIRIILDTKDDIFRDIEIEDHSTLEEVHNTIVQAFGFEGREMASFYTCDVEWNQEQEIALFDMGEDRSALRLMNETFLEDVLTEQNSKMLYVYDFLNMWTFFVELADIVDKEHGRAYPNLLFSFGILPDDPPEKMFGAASSSGFTELDFDDRGFDETWN